MQMPCQGSLGGEPCSDFNLRVKLQDLPCGGFPYCTRAHLNWSGFDQDVDQFSAESMQGYDTSRSLIYLNWIQVYQLAIDTILFYDIQVKKIVLLLLTYL